MLASWARSPRTTDLTTVRMWASWQQGRIQLVSGDTDGALASFCRAASAASHCPRGRRNAARATRRQSGGAVRELRSQQESHRQAEAALKQAEHEALNQLLADVRTPAWESDEVLGTYGWSRTPAPLKLPGLSTPRNPGTGQAGPARVRFRRPLLPRRRDGGDTAHPARGSRRPSLCPRGRRGPGSARCPGHARCPGPARYPPYACRHGTTCPARAVTGGTAARRGRLSSPYICSGHSASRSMTCQSGIGPARAAAHCSGTC